MRASGRVPAPEPGVRLPETARGLAGGGRAARATAERAQGANLELKTASVGSRA